MLGSRTADNEAAIAWAAETGARPRHVRGRGLARRARLQLHRRRRLARGARGRRRGQPGREDARGRRRTRSTSRRGFPPSLSVCNTDSLAEQIQRAHPGRRVVKALNTMNASVMVDPSLVPGEHDVFLCGDDDAAKAQAKALLEEFGWPRDGDPRPRRTDGRPRAGDVAAALARDLRVARHRHVQRARR